MKTTPHISGVYPHTCNTDANSSKALTNPKIPIRSMPVRRSQPQQQVRTIIAIAVDGNVQRRKQTDCKVLLVLTASAYPFRPIRSCLTLHVLKGLRMTAKNKDYVIH